MKFKIKFIGRTGYAVTLDEKQTGLDLVDRSRQELGVSNLELSRISSCVPKEFDHPEVTVSEGIARKSGHFRDCNKIRVFGENGFLNRFYEIKIEPDINPETGEVRKVKFRQALQTEALLNAWEDAGYPLEW